MGRALLILCMGSIVVFGIIQRAIQTRQLSQTTGQITLLESMHVRHLVNAALELELHRFLHGQVGDTVSFPHSLSLKNRSVDVFLDTHDSHSAQVPQGWMRLRTQTEHGNRLVHAHAFLTRSPITPNVRGAVGFYGSGSQVYLSGNAKIYGYDTDPASHPESGSGPENPLPAIVSVDTEEELVDRKGNASYTGEPDFRQEELDALDLHELVMGYKEQQDPYVEGHLGTPESPKITVLEGYHKISDVTNAAGILIVTEGSVLELRGAFRFEGLVIVQGNLDIRGNVHIFGALMFGDNSLLEIDEPEEAGSTFTGNTSIYYSSSALQQINQLLSNRFEESAFYVDRIYL